MKGDIKEEVESESFFHWFVSIRYFHIELSIMRRTVEPIRWRIERREEDGELRGNDFTDRVVDNVIVVYSLQRTLSLLEPPY